LLFLVAAALAAPLWAHHVAGTSYSETHLSDTITVDGRPVNVVSMLGTPIGPTWRAEFFLGADDTGRDLMVRLLYALRASLVISVGAVALTMAIGIPLALAAGYLRGRADSVISRVLDLIWSFPALLVGVLLGTALTLRGVDVGPVTIAGGSKLIPILVIGVIYVPYVARPLRAQALALRERQFVEAALASGSSGWRITRSELLPHLWPTLLVLLTVMFANAIVLESALSFLGAGVGPPEPSLGTLIADGVNSVGVSPHLLIVPCATLVILVLSLSGIAEGLRRAIGPSARSSDAAHWT
jgi:peptide/nickel transport system permease protein